MVSVDNERATPRLIFGMFVVGIGVLLLFDELDILNVGGIGRLWPLFPLIAGLNLMLAKGLSSGLPLVAIGGLFLLQNYTTLDFRDTWPAIIVVFGVGMVWEAVTGRQGLACASVAHRGEDAHGR